MNRPSPLAVAAALLLVVATAPLFLAWAFATNHRWSWLAVGAPIVGAAYGWWGARDEGASLRERLLPALVWGWVAAAMASSAVLAFA